NGRHDEVMIGDGTSCPIGRRERESMKQNNDNYQVVPYPKDRRAAVVLYRSAQRKPIIHGLLEVDVTRARAFLREHKAKTGESLSFTAFLATCLGKAVDENKAVQACRKGRKYLILFDDVDVMIQIERDMAGQKQPIPYTIRAANRKTFREIHHEIKAAQVEDVPKAWERFKAFQFLPIFLFRFLW
ncbi:MAG: 2-oxo acid dehydrogenase subunit E2, partial [Chloroflexi bacterium]